MINGMCYLWRISEVSGVSEVSEISDNVKVKVE